MDKYDVVSSFILPKMHTVTCMCCNGEPAVDGCHNKICRLLGFFSLQVTEPGWILEDCWSYYHINCNCVQYW